MTAISTETDRELRFSLETDKDEQGQLATYNIPGETGTREIITEEEIQDT